MTAEIRACLAARDFLLSEAETNPTEANLRRVARANQFAEECLRPFPAPYHEQALSRVEAERELQGCKLVKLRLARLHHRAALRHAA